MKKLKEIGVGGFGIVDLVENEAGSNFLATKKPALPPAFSFRCDPPV